MSLETLLEGAGFSEPGRLGSGGGGVVLRATHPHFGAVAVKVLVTDPDVDPKARIRFAREAANLARVQHPALVPLLTAGDLEDGSPYIVMPLLDGPTLAQRLRNGKMSLPTARATLDRIAGALAALHAEGILHRDVKPENVMLTSNGAVLLDLGIAKDEDASGETTEGAVRGTPKTMAPERMFGAKASKQSDVYELALLFYTMLVGKVPWADDADPLARLAPPPLSDVPTALSDAVLRAMSTRPERRPASIEELMEKLSTTAVAEEQSETYTKAPEPPPAPLPPPVIASPVTDSNVFTPPPMAVQPLPKKQKKPTWLLPATGAALVLVAVSVVALKKLDTPTAKAAEPAATPAPVVTETPAPVEGIATLPVPTPTATTPPTPSHTTRRPYPPAPKPTPGHFTDHRQ